MKPDDIKAGFSRVGELLEDLHKRDEDDIHPHIKAKLEELGAWATKFSDYAAGEKARVDDLEERVKAFEDGLASLGAPLSSTVSSGAVSAFLSGSAAVAADPSLVVGGGSSTLAGAAPVIEPGSGVTSVLDPASAGVTTTSAVIDPATGALPGTSSVGSATVAEPAASVEAAATTSAAIPPSSGDS